VDLRSIAGSVITAVNPDIFATVMSSTGYTIAPDGKQTPAYNTVTEVPVQVQSLSFRDLMQVEGLNLNGEKRAIYIKGKLDGTVRVAGKGGDLIVINNGTSIGTWLVVQSLEQWPDWCKVAVVLQDGS